MVTQNDQPSTVDINPGDQKKHAHFNHTLLVPDEMSIKKVKKKITWPGLLKMLFLNPSVTTLEDLRGDFRGAKVSWVDHFGRIRFEVCLWKVVNEEL